MFIWRDFETTLEIFGGDGEYPALIDTEDVVVHLDTTPVCHDSVGDGDRGLAPSYESRHKPVVYWMVDAGNDMSRTSYRRCLTKGEKGQPCLQSRLCNNSDHINHASHTMSFTYGLHIVVLGTNVRLD